MLSEYTAKQHLLCTMEPALVNSGLTRNIAAWLIQNIKLVKPETLRLADYLVENKVDHEAAYLNLSKVTLIGCEMESFVEMYNIKRVTSSIHL